MLHDSLPVTDCTDILVFVYSSNLQSSIGIMSTEVSKGKVYHTTLREVGGCSSSSPRPWAHAENQCLWRMASAMPDLYGYLLSRNARWLVPNYTAWWQRHNVCVNNLPRVALNSSIAGRPGFEPATCWSQVQHPNDSADSHIIYRWFKIINKNINNNA